MTSYIDRCVAWHRRRSDSRVLKAIVPVVFLMSFIVIPAWWVNARFEWSMGLERELRLALGLPIAAVGLALYLWTIVLFAGAGGTQVPLAPTRTVVTSGPYALSRNPMVTSVGIMVCGVALVSGSWSVLVAGLLVPSPYLVYIKLVEEKELEARFGAPYTEYKRSTPFIVPSLRSRRRV